MPVAPQFRKNSRAVFPFKKKGSSKKRPASAPAKRTKALVRRVVQSELKKDVELKLKPLRAANQVTPLAQATTGTASNIVWYQNYCLGTAATSWTGPTGVGNFTNLEGFTWPQGPAQGERIGRYLNLKHTTCNLRVACNNLASPACPIRFRVIIYKAKRNSSLGSAGGNPNVNLFLNLDGTQRGINNSYTGDSVSMEFMNMLVNKRNYDVHTDTQFVLASHTYSVQGGSNIVTPISQGYPAEKNLLLRLNHNEKTSFTGDQPDDLNYQYCMTILSMPYGDNTAVSARGWKSNVRGVVSATDE